MGRVEKSIITKAPPEKAWEMLALDRFPEWMDDLKSAEYTSEVRTPEDKYRVGASAHWIKVKQEEFDFEITESLEKREDYRSYLTLSWSNLDCNIYPETHGGRN